MKRQQVLARLWSQQQLRRNWTKWLCLKTCVIIITQTDTVIYSLLTYHTWQFIIFTIFTITACIISYSLSLSF